MSLRDPISAVVIFAFTTAAFIMAGNYGGGSGMFPRIISAIMMFLSVLLFIRGIVRPTAGEPITAGEIGRVAFVIVMTFIYIVSVDTIGFVTSSVIFVPVVAYTLGIRNHLLVWLSTIFFVSLVAYVFRSIFHVPLPREVILTFF